MPNRHCTKNCGNGKWKTAFATTLLLCFQLWPSILKAAPVPQKTEGGRRLWVLEQIATPPTPTFRDKNRTQASFQFNHLSDSLSLQESALLNLYYVEIGSKFSQRLHTLLGDDSAALKASSVEERNTVTFELARNFITATNHYGRLGFEYVHFFPRKTRYLHIDISMGMLESAEVPYSFKIQISHFKLLAYDEYNIVGEHEEGNPWLLSSEIGHALKNEENSKWRVGGYLTWSYRQRDKFEVRDNFFKLYEHILFSFGPFTEWFNETMSIRLAANFRLFVDKSIEMANSPSGGVVPQAGYPMSLGIPDLNFRFTYVF